MAKKVSNGDASAVTAGDLNTELTNQGASADGSNQIIVTFTSSGRQYNIDSNGTITYAGEKNGNEIINTEINILEFSIAGTPVAEVDIPVPTGFTHTEGTKDKGYVITNNTTGDQFVWVPVDKEQKIKVKVTSSEPITSIILTNPVGEEKLVGNVSGTEYEVDPESFTKVYNGMYTLQATTENGATANGTLVVRSLYAMDAFNDYFTDEWYESEECLNLWETRVGAPGDKTTTYQRLGNLADDEAFIAFAKQNTYNNLSYYSEPADDIDYAGRVASNGGFYIGRYEAGNDNDSLVIKSGQAVWNTIRQTTALSTAKSYNSSLNSSLLTGAAWDRTLGWLIETENKDLSQVVINSSNWGNYSDSTFTGTGSLANTGAFGDNTKANNIYDLAGNVSEWTTETSSDSNIVYRGGDYSNSGCIVMTSSYRTSQPSYTMNTNCGFRLALYL